MTADHTEEAPEGLVAGKYRLTRLLGKGGMGAVWEGVHATLDTRVAVKFIDREHADSDDLTQRFVNEAKAAARLRSKHVVQVYDQGVADDGRPYIVMEFLAGEPLDQRLERLGTLTVEDTARVLLQVARALSKAHEAGIIHRDLKPENIFLVWDEEDRTDVVKVVDFGIAKFTDPSTTSSSGSTRTGAVLGTPHYMSPEQARGLRNIDGRADVWSLGVIAYRAVLGTLPFEGQAVGDLLVKICTTDPAPPSSIDPSLPAGFDEWMQRALARDPEKRFKTATELSESLCALCGIDAALPASLVASGPRDASVDAPRALPSGDGTAAPLTTTLSGGGRRGPILVAGIGAIVIIGLVALLLARSLGGAAEAAEEPLEPEGAPAAMGAPEPHPDEALAEPGEQPPSAGPDDPEVRLAPLPEPEQETTKPEAAPPPRAPPKKPVVRARKPARKKAAAPKAPAPKKTKDETDEAPSPADRLGY